MGEYCNNCREQTETNFRQMVNNYVIHECGKCGADKRDCGTAPV